MQGRIGASVKIFLPTRLNRPTRCYFLQEEIFILIDTKTVETARNTDMIVFLGKHNGFSFVRRGDAYRCVQHPSLAVKADRLSWYWHSRGIGGYGVLDYLMKVEHLPFREAVAAVSGVRQAAAAVVTAMTKDRPEPAKSLILPEKAGMPLRLYDYLCLRRGIDGGIVSELIQKGMLYEDRRGNIVFVGFDEHGRARFASLRGTYGDAQFRMDCAGSDKRYGFHMACPASERLYLFESPIDAMSHASLEIAATGDAGAWRRHSRLSLAGTSGTALPFFLNQHPAVNDLVLCLDNDPAGREASGVLAREYTEKGFQTRLELPHGKDFNDDLTTFLMKKRLHKRALLKHKGVHAPGRNDR